MALAALAAKAARDAAALAAPMFGQALGRNGPQQIILPARPDEAERPRRERSSSRIPERRKMRKVRRRPSDLSVVEPPRTVSTEVGSRGQADEASTPAPRKRQASDNEEEQAVQETAKRRHVGKRQAQEGRDGNDKVVLELLPPSSFSDDYFVSTAVARGPKPGVACAVAAALQKEPEPTPRTAAHGGERWLRLMRLGFSLLVQGVGSKRRLLEAFADETLLPWGASVVRIDGYDTHTLLAECFRDILDQLHPNAGRAGAGQVGDERRSHSSVEGLVSALRAARAAEASPRPLCLVVHNLDQISSAQQGALASLAAAPGVHLVASIDSIWAPLAWHARVTRDFNWCREEAHTFEGYEVEAAARHRDGLPNWCDPTAVRNTATKASLGLVLRSLTGSHRELVEVIAKQQLDNGGSTGISVGKLLGIASDRMIASSVTKLRSLLNELKDHEVVRQRVATDGETLFHIACSGKVLERLAEGLAPEESDAEDSEHENENENDA